MASNPPENQVPGAPAPENQAFLREVDEEYRRDQMLRFWRRWGVWIVVAVLTALIALAIWLYAGHRSTVAAERQGDLYDTALMDLSENQIGKASETLAKLRETGNIGYSAMARFSEANILLRNDKLPEAAEKFGAIAADTRVPQPLRELAVVRQTLAEYDTLEPAIVVDRLKALAVPDSAWFGTAGEMVAAAYLKQGKRQEAGELYGQIARAESVPASIRQRAVQMAGVLGVDATEDPAADSESDAAGDTAPGNATGQTEDAQ